MFRQRLLTTLILVPLVLLAIYFGGRWLLGSIVLLLSLALGWEWLQLIPIKSMANKLMSLLVLIPLIWLSVHWLQGWLSVGLVLWGFILIAVLRFPGSETFWGYRVVVAGFGLILLPLFASTISALYQQSRGQDLIVYLLCLVWATDIGAYLAGKQWGRCKLIPQVSPGKTIEGAAGGLSMAMVVSLVGYVYFKPTHSMAWFAVAVCTILISMLGDLFISMLKRRCHLKDTGHLIPGHGGVLDRLDSLIAALPLFYFGLRFIV